MACNSFTVRAIPPQHFVETRRATSPFASVFSPMVCRDAFLRLLQRVCHISHRLCGLSCLLRRKNASLHLRCVAFFSAAFVETWRAASPFASVFSPMACRDAFLRLLPRFAYPSPLMQPFLLAETQECVSTFTVVPSLLSGFCRDAARHVSLASVFSPMVCRDAFLRLLPRFCLSLTAYAGLSCLPRRKNASLHLQCAPSLLSSFCRDAARHVSIYNNVRARASLKEVQPSKGSGGMMRYCIRLGWLKPVRGFFFAKIREKCDSSKSFKEKVDNDTSRKVSAPLGKAYLKEIT